MSLDYSSYVEVPHADILEALYNRYAQNPLKATVVLEAPCRCRLFPTVANEGFF